MPESLRYHPHSWRAPEYTYHEKTPDWYWGFGSVAAALLFIAYLTESVLFGFIIVIGGFGMLLYTVRKPHIVTISVTGQGIEIDDRLFPYETLHSFWIFYRPGERRELILKSSRGLAHTIKIPLADANPVEIREYLLQYLPERAEEESMLDILARILKF